MGSSAFTIEDAPKVSGFTVEDQAAPQAKLAGGPNAKIGPQENILPRFVTDLALSGIEPGAIEDIWNTVKSHFGDAKIPGTGKSLSDTMSDAEKLYQTAGSEAALLSSGPAVESIGTALESGLKTGPRDIANAIADFMRKPATPAQSARGEAGTLEVRPPFHVDFGLANKIVPKGELGTPTNPGPYMRIPLRVPKGSLSEMASPSFGAGGTFTNAANLPPAEPYTAPPIGSTTNPNIRIVRQFETEAEPEPSRIVSPSSKPPATRVTYQSVPKTDLKNLVMEGDKEAITEWQRRGLPLPDNVRFLIESGATRNPWRNYPQ